MHSECQRKGLCCGLVVVWMREIPGKSAPIKKSYIFFVRSIGFYLTVSMWLQHNVLQEKNN